MDNHALITRIALILYCCIALSAAPSFAADPVIGNRTFNVINQCPFPVWFSFNGSQTANKNGGDTCASNADCASGSVCNTANKHCYFAPPTPANGQYKLTANGGTNTVTIPIYGNTDSKIWTGRAAGRTNCTSSGCETGDCSGGEGQCPLGKGFKQPLTIAEFSLNKTKSDFYDISAVNGLSIPVEMAALNPVLDQSPYHCANPGGVIPVTKTGSCSWDMLTPSNDFRRVASGGNACSIDADCSAPAVCGISINSGTPKLRKTCGKLLGYFTPDEICGQQKDYGAPFYCAQTLPPPQQNLTLYHLYKCNTIDSCYKSGALNTCCGCVNWDQIGIGVPPAPLTQQCVNKNPTWINEALPKLSWIKKACPTVYVYPYDDPSSTFTCKNLKNNVNSVNYAITFCPGGKTGGIS